MGGNTGGVRSGKESVATAVMSEDLPVPGSPTTTTWQRVLASKDMAAAAVVVLLRQQSINPVV